MADAHGISIGELTSKQLILPLIPTGFVVARNVSITADWSSDDKKYVENAVTSKASVGSGPFIVSGNFSHSSSSDYHKSTFDGSTLKIPGIQIIAWISEITPNSSKEGHKARHAIKNVACNRLDKSISATSPTKCRFIIICNIKGLKSAFPDNYRYRKSVEKP